MTANHVLFCGLEQLDLPKTKKSIKFSSGFTLTQDKSHMRNAEEAGLVSNFGLLEWGHLQSLPWHFMLEIKSLHPDGPIALINHYNSILDTILQSSWIVADNAANLSDSFLIWHSDAGINVSANSFVKRYTACSQEAQLRIFSPKELDDWLKAAQIFNTHDISATHPNRTQIVKGLSPWALYLSNIQLARMANDAALKIMQYCIAFESLFSTSTTELSHTVAERIAIVRSRNKSRRIETYRTIDLPPLTRPLTLGKSRLLFCEILPGSDLLNRCAV